MLRFQDVACGDLGSDLRVWQLRFCSAQEEAHSQGQHMRGLNLKFPIY